MEARQSSPRGGDNGAAARRWCGDGGPVGRRGHEAEERKGAMECSGTCARGRTEDKERGGCGGDGAPFIGDTAGGGGRVTGGTTQWRGVGGVGPARRSGGAV
jgi:hypothetical protein